MKIEPLEFRHKELLTAKFKSLSLDISEYTFANLYLFRQIHQYEVVEDFDLFIRGRSRDGRTYLMPTTSIQNLDTSKLSQLLKSVDCLYPIPEGWLEYFKGDFSISFDESESDYVYTLNTFREYPGRHLSGRRNLVNQFVDHFIAESHPLTQGLRDDALKVLNAWRAHNTADGEADYEACHEAINLVDELGLTGSIYYVDKEPVGFILGEKLNSRMFVEHFAKTGVLLKGLYQYMYQQFAKELDDHYLYVNMEQDLGDSGLKQSKRSYMPIKLVTKYRIK